VTAESRFSTAEEFENIILRANNDGTTVRLKDVARVELGPFVYGVSVTYNSQAVAGFAVQLQTGANALAVADAVKNRMDELQLSLPKGVTWFAPYDTTPFIQFSIHEVVKTLCEAIVLVFIVMLVFLQNLRMTIIALLVVPVALMGGFLGLWMAGFTINQLTLFGMVLVIGIVVDDAIVVIENVERLMDEEGLAPKEATRKAMEQISGAVVAIAVVLMAVFIPSAAVGLGRRHLPAVLRDDRIVHGVFGVPSPHFHAGAVRDAAQAAAPDEAEERLLPGLQPRLRLGAENLYRPCAERDPPRADVDGGVRCRHRAVRFPVLEAAVELRAR
jgi:hypothetical protein